MFLVVRPAIFDQLCAILTYRPETMSRSRLQVGLYRDREDNLDWVQLVEQSKGDLTLEVQDVAFKVGLYGRKHDAFEEQELLVPRVVTRQGAPRDAEQPS